MPSQAYVSVWRNSVRKRTVTTGLSDKVDTKKQRSKTVAPDATEDRTGFNELSERVPSASVGPQARRDNLAPTSKALDGSTTNFTGFKDDQPIHSGAPAELDEQPASERTYGSSNVRSRLLLRFSAVITKRITLYRNICLSKIPKGWGFWLSSSESRLGCRKDTRTSECYYNI